MVKLQPSKLAMRVRFSLPAPQLKINDLRSILFENTHRPAESLEPGAAPPSNASVEAATREETEPAHPNCIVVYERLNAIASLALYPDPRLPAETAFALTGLYLHRP
jgi:hypothetical protein